MRKLNVLMPTMEYDMIKVGGLSAALTSIAKGMKKYANPKIIAPKSGFEVPWKKVDEIEYRNVTMEIYEHMGVNVSLLSNEVLNCPEIYPEPMDIKTPEKIDEFGKAITEVIDDIDFDLVHMHDLFGYKAMPKFKEMNKPILLTIHRLHREFPNWFKRELFAIDNADFITVVGKSYYKEDEGELFSRYAGKVTHVYNGIDTEFWSEKNCRYSNLSRAERRKRILEENGLEDGVFFLYVGRFDPAQKGVDIMLSAGQEFLKEKDARMIIVGFGDKKLEKLSKKFEAKYPSKVKVINSLLPEAEARELYCAADFAVVPSLFEPFGLVQLEAMACGCVPIGSKTGGIKDTVVPYPRDGATGFLFEKGKVEALNETMKKAFEIYCKNINLIEQMRRNGRKRCEGVFQWDSSCKKYFKIYTKLLASKSVGVRM